MKLYLLYYDMETGSAEEWNVFYTPCEIFSTPEKRRERIAFIKKNYKKKYEFHTEETELMDNSIEALD